MAFLNVKKATLRLAPILTLLLLLAGASSARADDGFFVLSYHDVQDDPARQRLGDAVTIATADLVAHFAWLREHHYTVVSLEDILAARAGTRPLPPKAVLLTFDDGYASTYTRVFPLLKLFGYPAVVAPVASWIEQPAGGEVAYGDTPMPREGFVSWAQLREMADSGLVEIASHGYDLHHGIPGNPQGNLQPAATTPAWDAVRGYEDDATHLARVRRDLERSVRIIGERTGRQPRAMVWPYGRYNEALNALAAGLGMTLSLELGDHGANQAYETGVIRRAFITHGATIHTLIDAFNATARPAAIRAVQVDLDYVYDPDPAQQERNLDRLLDRIQALGVNTVYLQAYADPDGDGNADALYFPNRHLPVRADLFNRVAWQLATRTRVKVYAWLPVLAYTPPEGHPLRGQMVVSNGDGHHPPRYARLSPFSAEARDFVGDIYEDLARHAYIAGLLFHDDAVLADDEDASPAAIAVYTAQWGMPATITEIHADPTLAESWARRKTQLLVEWTDELAARARAYQPNLRTARNLYAPVALDAAAQSRFAQSLPLSLARYDYTVVMAMPFLEEQRKPLPWLAELATRVSRHPAGFERTVFELQAVDWRGAKRPVDSAVLRGQIELLQRLGARHLAYYPDDFIAGHPDLSTLGAAMSAQTYPHPE